MSTEIKLSIEGMDCANCALGITRKLTKSGNSSVSVNFATGDASLVLGENCTIDSVTADVESLGYKVVRADRPRQKKFLDSVSQKFWICLFFTVPLFFSHMFFGHDFFLNQPYVQLALCIPVFLLGLVHFGRSAFRSLKSGVPNMDVLIFIGSSSAFGYSLAGIFLYSGHDVHDYLFFETSATIITLVLLGNLLEHISVKRTTTAIHEISGMQPEKARLVVKHDQHEHIREITAAEVKVGDILLVNTGDAVPVDGIVLQGEGLADESMLTGESIPVEKSKGMPVTGGTILNSGSVRMQALNVGKETVLAQIIDLVKNAQLNKPAIQKLGDKVSAVFVPIVLLIAAATFLIAFYFFETSLQRALMNSIAVLVISCPCAMGLATPTAVMVGIGRAARNGILIRGGSTLEELARVNCIVFDKTGTLTTGNFEIAHFSRIGDAPEEEMKKVILELERRSSHPVARSLVRILEKEGVQSSGDFSRIREEKGIGISGTDAQGRLWRLSSFKALKSPPEGPLHDIYLLRDDQAMAAIDLLDELKPNAKETIGWFNKNGFRTIMLSGDREEKCKEIAEKLGMQEYHAGILPGGKMEIIEQLNRQFKVAMVGDGVNDAPALTKAHVGIAAGEGAQAAIRSAQVVLLAGRDLDIIRELFQLGKHTLTTIRQNLFWAFFYNVVAIPIAATGLLSPMIGALSMAFSDVIVIGNSIRLRTKKLR
ncbi:MAG: Cu2+-exporting ATPase [Bacteroidetes bacterium]|nr:MAG: Cu2+-exporting ATPase [Bacteroidota bacterium]